MRLNRKSLNEYARSLTIAELIATLQEMANEVGDDAEVRFLSQPNWPFAHSIAGLVTDQAIANALNRDECDEEDDEAEVGDDEHGRAVYLVEGSQLSYGWKVAWDLI